MGAATRVRWTSKALSDLARLHGFLAIGSKAAADRAVKSLTAAAGSLAAHPRLGEHLDQFEEREVRRLLVGQFELRYEVAGGNVFILRLWHSREEH